MPAAETAAGLAAFTGRGGGTDAERRAAQWLAGQVRASRRQARVETFWWRSNWALAHAWHCLAAIAGSLLMVSHATAGGVVVLVVLLSVLADGLTGRSLGRRLTPERASQNVVSPAPVHQAATESGPDAPVSPAGTGSGPDAPSQRVRLIVTANYDAGRTGLAHRDAIRRPVAALKRLAGHGALTPGWLGWLSIELLWLLGVAVLRATGAAGTPVGVLQLLPTAGLVVELGLLLDLGLGPFGPAAGDNAAGTAVAVALVRALDAAPPRHATVELVLQGAGDGSTVGLRRHLRRRRRELTPRATVVLGIGPCGAGHPCWWISDGPLIPLRYTERLRALAAALGPGAGSPAASHRGRGSSPALGARLRGLPALTVGAVDGRGLFPRSHQPGDVAAALEPAALDRVLEFALLLVDALDAELSATTGRASAAPAAA